MVVPQVINAGVFKLLPSAGGIGGGDIGAPDQIRPPGRAAAFELPAVTLHQGQKLLAKFADIQAPGDGLVGHLAQIGEQIGLIGPGAHEAPSMRRPGQLIPGQRRDVQFALKEVFSLDKRQVEGAFKIFRSHGLWLRHECLPYP